MTLIVETGAIIANANTYISVADFEAFAVARGITIVGDSEQLLIQAMDYIESLIYQGFKLTQTQPLQWPRSNVWLDGYYVNVNTIPKQLKDGECFAALAIDAGTDALQPIQQQVVRERVGEIEVEYSAGSVNIVTDVKTNNALSKLLTGGGIGSNFVVGKA